MLKKKMKGVLMDSSSPSYAFDEETRSRLKYQSLVQDFHDLQKETEAIKKKLQKSKQRKLTVFAEVRFLRQRYEYLMELESQKTPLVEPDLARTPLPKIHREVFRKPKPPPILDLNLISNGDEEEFQDVLEKYSYPKKYSIHGNHKEQQAKQVSTNSGSGLNRSGKRKIAWQDQMALRV